MPATVLLMYGDGPPTAGHVARLEALPGVSRVYVAVDESSALAAASSADVFIGQRYLSQCLPGATQLAWVQSTAAGVEHLLTPELHRRHPLLTRCPIFADTIARHALSLALAASRRIPEARDAQRERRWTRPLAVLPWPTSAMVVGVGAIGSVIAQLLKALGIHVTGVTDAPVRGDEPVDMLLTRDNWRQALPRADWCFLAIPGTPENRHFMDASALASLPSHAVVVNVGRGMTLDTVAMAALLKQGRLGAAALDVTDPDPLPPADELWEIPGVVVTPKIAAFAPDRIVRLESFVEQQLARFGCGVTPLHRVDYHVER